MKRIIYATSDLDDWIDIAQNMQKNKAWEPIYWITTPKNNTLIKEAFPQTHLQGYLDAVRGIYTKYDLDFNRALDQKTIERYIKYEKIALKMMDRMDPTAYSFNLTERTTLYYDFLHYWINIIIDLKPDMVLFSESPHALFQYVLYAVCQEEKVKIVRFTPTHIEGLTFLSSSISSTPDYLLEIYNLSLTNKNIVMTEKAKRYLAKNRDDYSKALPYYMKNIISKKSLKEQGIHLLAKVERFFKNKISLAYKRSSRDTINNGNISKLDFLVYKVRGTFYKKKLQKTYNNFSASADLSKKYIYVALHYQPEKTTSPEGGLFVDQWLMINMLSTLAPKGWKVYTKEHISQFSDKLYGEQGRDGDFYRKISMLKNVQLIKSDINSFDLIDNAQVVATVTGTVGLEAVIRSKPLLSFGEAWYSSCMGVISIRDNEDLVKAFSLIEQEYVIEERRVNAFLIAIEQVSFSCYLNPGNKVAVPFGKKVNVENLTNCLCTYADKV